MTASKEYERIGKFIYSAYRHGGDLTDVHNWMADDLGVARPAIGDEAVPSGLYAAFFARYASDDGFHANYERFVDAMKARGA
jgi:hypothetical protein